MSTSPLPALPPHCQAVPLDKAYRLLSHGPTVLVSAAHGGVSNVMAAAWSCALDFSPPKVTVVIDKATATRALVEGSGSFALNLPCVAQAALTLALGSESALQHPDKLARHGVQTFQAPGAAGLAESPPLVAGCVGWLVCRVLPEPAMAEHYDLFLGEVVAAYADARVFRGGHWEFDGADDALRTLHYVAGGQFYRTGAGLKTEPHQPAA